MTTGLFQEIVPNLVTTVILLVSFSVSVIRLYNVFFHPCAHFPGPWTRAAFHWLYYWEQLAGVSPANILALHQKYGPVVRIAPDRLSFIRSPAWKDIYGFKQDRSQIPKDYKRFPIGAENYLPLFASNEADHTRLRRLVAHAFSETALREQEPLIQGHIDDLIDQFDRKIADSDPEINMDEWLDRLTFDILSDLTFGEPFGSVRSASTHKFIQDCYTGCDMTPALQMAWDYSIVDWLLKAIFRIPSIRLAREGSEAVNNAKIQKRIDMGPEARKDFMTYILRHNDNVGRGAASIGEIRGLTTVFLAAGGEEPSSLMSSVLFYLCKNPAMMQKTQQEIRQIYDSPKDIVSGSLERSVYLNAVIQEVFRLRPPGSGHFPRRTTQPTTVNGYVVPANTTVEVPAYAAGRSSDNFAEAERFVPERWLAQPPERFAGDDRAAVQPFMVGPRACIGKNLANLMYRSTLIHLIWRYDIEMRDLNQGWEEQTFRTVWHRPGLMLRTTRRKDL